MLRPVANPPPRFTADIAWEEPPELARLEVFEDHSQSILAKNDSPDLWHTWSLNPYRGCLHACAYCYARPTHEYLGFGAGSDHDTKIVVKPDAAALLERAFDAKSWQGERILFSGNTDCYQPLEHRYRLTRACLEVCLRYRNPVAIITKAALILRDLELLQALHREAALDIILSIPFFDPVIGRAIEPGAPPPARRFETLRTLAEAGLTVGVNVAPVIPGLNDRDIPNILQAAAEAGARTAGIQMVRLPGPVAEVFQTRLREALPLHADRVMAAIRRARGGALSDANFGSRQAGEGPGWLATRRLFDLWRDRLGLSHRPPEPPTTFRRPPKRGDQLSLF